MKPGVVLFSVAVCFLAGCSKPEPEKVAPKAAPPVVYFKVDPTTPGVLTGKVLFTGKKPPRTPISMEGEAKCASLHKGVVYDESVIVNRNGTLSNAFVYIKEGLEGKTFEPPTTPVIINQSGCSFSPRVFGIQTGGVLHVTNSDPVTHNIHLIAQNNREWNQSQAPGEPVLERKIGRPEVMIRVKCNVHSWMRAYMGAVSHPYFAVTGVDGSFEIRNVPPGDYTIEAWQEKLGTQETRVTLASSGKSEAVFAFKGE